MRYYLAILICMFWPTLCVSHSEQEKGSFISIADIHFDPFAGCSTVQKPCKILSQLRHSPVQEWPAIFEKYPNKAVVRLFHDTNYFLFQKTLQQLKEVKELRSPEFVLILGDFLRHDFDRFYKKFSGDKTLEGLQTFVDKTYLYINYELERVFSGIDVYPLIGNNDTYNNGYRIISNGKFLTQLRKIWGPLIKNKESYNNFVNQFADGGFYIVDLGAKKQLIVLNSVLFSSKSINAVELSLRQLQWLNRILDNASQHNTKSLIAFHIPEGIDFASTLKSNFKEVKKFWKPFYADAFKNTMEKHANEIVGIFSGHVHIDLYKTFMLEKYFDIPVVTTPSISPYLGNSPSFKVVTFDKNNFEIKKMDTYRFTNTLVKDLWRIDVTLLQSNNQEYLA